ncbi:MAG: hypothetical protein EOO20_09295 [Chryseobacterium sp.]|nr:MAG: hypothetical protein EOO20_09295 [Chryseobacterium sp.]
MSEDKKIEILMQALTERYNALHIIRDRVQNVCLWTLGLLVTAAGWLIQSTHILAIEEKIFFTIIILGTLFILRRYYLQDLERGFKSQQKIQARIENVLGLCKAGVFSEDPIYPQEWLNAGKTTGKGKFFEHNYLLIYTGTIILILSIWLS